MIKHERLETNSGLLLLFIFVIISIGGLIEVVPLFYIDGTIEEVKKDIPAYQMNDDGTFVYETDENGEFVLDRQGNKQKMPLYMTDDNGEFIYQTRAGEIVDKDARGARKIQATRKVDAVRPYTPLELLGRNVYVSEGCYNCHSQQIRPMQDEFERYGHYSLAAESQYDRPFQWGSRRMGPDLARVGGKMDNQWHVDHLVKPQDRVEQSIMPAYPWLIEQKIDYKNGVVAQHMKTLRILGVPYSSTVEEYNQNVVRFGEDVAKLLDIGLAELNLEEQAEEIRKTYQHDNKLERISKMDALVAYLQVLGTMVEFKDDQGLEFSEFR